jgi:2-polyprenyl-3-methyl-5-hydroxy-6-metoxy-1,4-benzoquinol methylase
MNSTDSAKTTAHDAILVPSPPSAGERARERGLSEQSPQSHEILKTDPLSLTLSPADGGERTGSWNVRSRAICKICGGRSRFLCTTPCSHDKSLILHHHRCRDCGLVFVADKFTNEQLGTAYGAFDEGQYYEEIRATEAAKFVTARENLQRLGVTPASRILDIGAGNGDFLASLQDAGFKQLSGHEIPGADTKQFDQRGIRVYKDYDYSTLPAGAFDVVTMLDVMEHVPNPHAVCAAVHRALVPGGLLYFHTPFVTPLDRLMHGVQQLPVVSRFGRAWQRCRTSIYHLQNYTPSAVEQVLRENGLEVAGIRVQNELTWPLWRYVKIYMSDPLRWPTFTAHLIAPFTAPLIATNLMNSNKGIVSARKPAAAAATDRRAA